MKLESSSMCQSAYIFVNIKFSTKRTKKVTDFLYISTDHCCNVLNRMSEVSLPSKTHMILQNLESTIHHIVISVHFHIQSFQKKLIPCTYISHCWSQSWSEGHSFSEFPITLLMLKLISSKSQGSKDIWKPSKPCYVGTHLKAVA